MIVNTSLICFFAVLLINTNLATTLEFSQATLDSLHRIALSKQPEEINNLVRQALSHENVQLGLKSILPSAVENVQARLANEDLLEVLVKTYVEPSAKLSLLQQKGVSVDNVQAVLDGLNSEVGGVVLVITNNSVTVDVSALEKVILTYSIALIRENYSNNIFLQIALTEIVKGQIELIRPKLTLIFEDVAISLDAINEIVSATTGNRSKRDLVGDIFLYLIRLQLSAILTPIQNDINNVLNSILTDVLSLYSAEQPAGAISTLVRNITNVAVIRVAEVVVYVQDFVNSTISNIIYGPTDTSSRRRRDINMEFDDFYNLEEVNLKIAHRRLTRSINPIQPILDLISLIISLFTGDLNSFVKKIFIGILATQYTTIGTIVSLPLRIVVNTLIDAILPCTTCISIV